MKKKTIKWAGGVIGLIFLGAIGSGLWQIGIQPVFEWISEKVLNITTLGISSLNDAFYREVAEGFHEEPSLENLMLLLTIIFGYCGIKFGEILNDRRIERFRKENDGKIEKFISNRVIIIVAVTFISFLTFRQLTIGQRNHKVTKFRQLFTMCKPILDEQEEEKILAEFSRIKTKQDYLDIIMTLVKKNIEHTQDLLDSIDIQKEPK